MPSEKTTRQGQAWDQLAKDAYGDELRLGTLFPENVDELDVLIFGGDVRVAAPEAYPEIITQCIDTQAM